MIDVYVEFELTDYFLVIEMNELKEVFKQGFKDGTKEAQQDGGVASQMQDFLGESFSVPSMSDVGSFFMGSGNENTPTTQEVEELDEEGLDMMRNVTQGDTGTGMF